MTRHRTHELLPGKPPRIYVGPNAWRATRGEKGLLLGARRVSWIDVLEFDPRPSKGIRVLVELRFSDWSPWEVVGLSVSTRELARRRRTLLRELVPGDLVLTEKGASIHTGTAWVEAPVQNFPRRRAT